jgi:phosphoribosyl-ATP pyrophosphohydrolase/phosphoribosyl-AMP cyclohydrolase/histidinol dehydrogenase
VEDELERQLSDLPTSAIVLKSIGAGFAVIVEDLTAAATISNALALEHVALRTENADRQAAGFTAYGSIFLGPQSAETYADYGIGPNHVLPTSGSARFQSCLSVSTFLRSQTWLRLSDPGAIRDDLTVLARLEGLEGHARAALARTPTLDST